MMEVTPLSETTLKFSAVTLLVILAIGLYVLSPGWAMFGMLLLQLVSAAIVLPIAFKHRSNKRASGNLRGENDQREYQLLLESIHEYPMPFAIYDEQDRLCTWNKHYENIYARVFNGFENTADAKGMSYRDILRGNVADGASGPDLERTIEQRVQAQRSGEQTLSDQQYPDYGWFRVTKYVTPSGGVAGIAIDINELKRRENELTREIERRRQLEIEIRKVANTDGLTGIANRRHFMEYAELEFGKAENKGAVFSFLMIDVDHFKSINDTKGHAGGDEVLTMIAGAISAECCQSSALVGRLGGEEFAVLLPHMHTEDARELGETIRESVENLVFVFDGVSSGATVSLGVATTLNQAETGLQNLMKDADEALYDSKRNGRNRISVSTVNTDQSLKKGS